VRVPWRYSWCSSLPCNAEPPWSASRLGCKSGYMISLSSNSRIMHLDYFFRTSENFPYRDCLETSRRVVDRLCLVLQECEMGHFRPLLATRYTPNRGLFGLSRQSL
jgi:hypothetical protein